MVGCKRSDARCSEGPFGPEHPTWCGSWATGTRTRRSRARWPCQEYPSSFFFSGGNPQTLDGPFSPDSASSCGLRVLFAGAVFLAPVSVLRSRGSRLFQTRLHVRSRLYQRRCCKKAISYIAYPNLQKHILVHYSAGLRQDMSKYN